jgi:hypothetical protein
MLAMSELKSIVRIIKGGIDMASPVSLETPILVQSPDLAFVRPFGPETDVANTVGKMIEIFKAAGNLAEIVNHVTTHESEAVQPTLGILDQYFERVHPVDGGSHKRAVKVAPMGVSEGAVLLGTTPTSELTIGKRENKEVDLLGTELSPHYYGFAYVTLEALKHLHGKGGFGLMVLRGRATVFSERPSTEQLIELVHAVPEAGSESFPVNRIDITEEQSRKDRRNRIHASIRW